MNIDMKTNASNHSFHKSIYRLVITTILIFFLILSSSSSTHHVSAFNILTSPLAPGQLTTILTQASSCAITYISLIAYYDRPRGQLSIDVPKTLEVKSSQIPGAGLGLYAKIPLPSGTILGTYPGVVRPMGKYMKKYDKLPHTGTYAWRLTDNMDMIDPTDRNGYLTDYCRGGSDDFPLSYLLHEGILSSLFSFWSVPTLLTRINEPPIGGGGCNVRTEENLKTREVVFLLSRDVVPGEELFMDYGLTYDRSSYQG